MCRIVVTGTGIVSALGIGKAETLDNLMAEQRALRPVQYVRTMHSCLPVGEVPYNDDELKGLLSVPADERIPRSPLLGRLALQEALSESRLSGKPIKRVAFINGNTVGGMEKTEQFYNDLFDKEDNEANIALHDCGACTDVIVQGADAGFDLVTTISTACSSAANALVAAANLIRAGIVDIAVAGGTECLSRFHLNGFNALRILDNEPCRPFDAHRNGLNLGEGAAYLVLETPTSAARRGVPVLCELSGYANVCDAYHQTATSPDGAGAVMAMSNALAMSGLQPADIDYVNAHGTGTANNDLSEGVALMRVFGKDMPKVSSTKSSTGHATSAAGSIESVIAVLALQHRFVPANVGFDTQMPELTFSPEGHVRNNVELRHVLNNSFAFGGNDTACIFSMPGTVPPRLLPKRKNAVYLRSAAQISAQKPLSDDWFSRPERLPYVLNESQDPDFAGFFPPMESRRMCKLIKRAIVTSLVALGEHGMPDAVITGTGLGCMHNTEKFLHAMLDNGEEFLQPTFFMQSTHNTIGSQIAIRLKCHGYNCTYAHRSTSFDSALLDALVQMELGQLRSALVGGHDEMTPAYFELSGKLGCWKKQPVECTELRNPNGKGTLAGSVSCAMLLSASHSEDALCRVSGMTMLYGPDSAELQASACRLLAREGITPGNVSAVVAGLNGDCDNDRIYLDFIRNFRPDVPVMWYKHIFGESFCASALGVYAGALALHRRHIPAHLRYDDDTATVQPQYLLVHNHFHNKDHTLTLLALC